MLCSKAICCRLLQEVQRTCLCNLIKQNCYKEGTFHNFKLDVTFVYIDLIHVSDHSLASSRGAGLEIEPVQPALGRAPNISLELHEEKLNLLKT